LKVLKPIPLTQEIAQYLNFLLSARAR